MFRYRANNVLLSYALDASQIESTISIGTSILRKPEYCAAITYIFYDYGTGSKCVFSWEFLL